MATSEHLNDRFQLCRTWHFLIVKFSTLLVLNGFRLILRGHKSPHLILEINSPEQRLRHLRGSQRWSLLVLFTYFESSTCIFFHCFTLTGCSSNSKLSFFFFFFQPKAVGFEIFADNFPREVISPSSLYFSGCGRLRHRQQFQRRRSGVFFLSSCCNLSKIYDVLLCNYFI